MSRNFELLRQVDKVQDLFRISKTVFVPVNGKRPRLDPEALAREEGIKFIQRVFLKSGPEAPQAVVFASVEHGNGGSWICARAGETLAAQVKGSVCVVDANLRAPSLHHYFAVDNLTGLTDAILHPGPVRNYTQQLNGSNLWLVASGSPSSDPHPLLTSDRLRTRVVELCAEFEHVLIDAPPINQYADPVLLGQMADGLILVVEANATRPETARKAKESLEAANVRLLGAVLNKRTFPIPEALYHKL
jgi:capsular exopolysaccharide synthesis family protein